MAKGSSLPPGFPGALGATALAIPKLAFAQSPTGGVTGAESHVGEIYQLQAAFHRAKTFQDLDLMASLWAEDATLTNQGDPHSPYTGNAAIKAFFAPTGSFTHRRLSLVPSFKTQINVGHQGDHAWLYFECHDVGDYERMVPYRELALAPTRSAAATFSELPN